MAHMKYHVGPSERRARQEAKINQLEREIKAAEKQMLERAAILHRLGAIQAAEEKEHSDQLVSKYRRRSLTVEQELERVYGKDTAREYTESPDLQPRAVEDVIAYRTKEFELKQQEKALQIKYLTKERERLQDAREKLKEKRLALERLSSPVGKETEKTWGKKYKIYTPMAYDEDLNIFSPRTRVQYGEWHHFFPHIYDPWGTYKYRMARKKAKNRAVFVPMSLYNSW